MGNRRSVVITIYAPLNSEQKRFFVCEQQCVFSHSLFHFYGRNEIGMNRIFGTTNMLNGVDTVGSYVSCTKSGLVRMRACVVYACTTVLKLNSNTTIIVVRISLSSLFYNTHANILCSEKNISFLFNHSNIHIPFGLGSILFRGPSCILNLILSIL